MKKTANISLVGFMAAGKTVVSNSLAKLLNKDVVSTDALIIEREGRTIAEIFKNSGEKYFRDVEKKVVKEACELENVIIDCGGGVVLDQENIDNLKRNSILIYLQATGKTLFERSKGQTHRPLLNVEDPMAKIEDLLNKRKLYYEKAEYIVNTENKTLEQVCEEIRKIVDND